MLHIIQLSGKFAGYAAVKCHKLKMCMPAFPLSCHASRLKRLSTSSSGRHAILFGLYVGWHVRSSSILTGISAHAFCTLAVGNWPKQCWYVTRHAYMHAGVSATGLSRHIYCVHNRCISHMIMKVVSFFSCRHCFEVTHFTILWVAPCWHVLGMHVHMRGCTRVDPGPVSKPGMQCHMFLWIVAMACRTRILQRLVAVS